jgi:hypothetical protein
MLSIGLWSWYINVTITILDIIHRRGFLNMQRFGDWILSQFVFSWNILRWAQKKELVSVPDLILSSLSLMVTNSYSMTGETQR